MVMPPTSICLSPLTCNSPPNLQAVQQGPSGQPAGLLAKIFKSTWAQYSGEGAMTDGDILRVITGHKDIKGNVKSRAANLVCSFIKLQKHSLHIGRVAVWLDKTHVFCRGCY